MQLEVMEKSLVLVFISEAYEMEDWGRNFSGVEGLGEEFWSGWGVGQELWQVYKLVLGLTGIWGTSIKELKG